MDELINLRNNFSIITNPPFGIKGDIVMPIPSLKNIISNLPNFIQLDFSLQ